FLRMLFVGSEPANNIYNKNLDLINIYACSESGFAVGVFKIDQPYETCPIGRPAVETKIIRLNENGEEVPDDEIGELCFENPYVRGYLNLPEETARAFVDGIYHTGDLARMDPYAPYREGRTVDTDMLIGTNANESNYWINDVGGFIPFRFSMPIQYENRLSLLSPEDRKRARKFVKLKKEYSLWRVSRFFDEVMFRLPAVRQAEGHSRNGGRAYMYYWEKRSHLPHLRACHAVELAYVFGNVDDTIYNGKRADPDLSRQVQDQWVRFAETGDPGTPELPWPPYDEKDRWTMILREDSEAVKDPLSRERETLDPILDYRFNASYADLNLNVPFFWKSLAKLLGILLLIALVIWLIIRF
ncbi:MAG: carboxylesterase family protein, partial [Clostridiales bacterium]|nr:carboxylesterase family protein [Clostridiales bacterium]